MMEWIALLVLFSATTGSASSATDDCEASDHVEKGGGNNACSVYLAPSSVPNGGMGMFTAKDVQRGGIILPADGPSIPIIDPDYYSQRSRVAWVELFQRYWWDVGNGQLDPTVYEAGSRTVEFQITMGALPNSHPYLNNLDAANPSIVPYDDSLVTRGDPGAGAFSYYSGRHATAHRRDMNAGEEIFLDYPEQQMNHICQKNNIPNRQDYLAAASTLSNFLHMFEGEAMAHAASGEPLTWSGSDTVVSLLPRSQSDLDRILLSSEGSCEQKDLALAIAKEMSVEKRSPDWLEKNGICLDNIMPGRSSNPHAGRGAIAQRSMKKGSVIAPAPLLQVTDRDALRIPAFEGEKMQLMLNYCFGRDDSSLLLCPNTNAVLLNHCSSRRPEVHPCDSSRGPNADYRWANWDESTGVWLDKTIDDMESVYGTRGLSLEIFATRDIEVGEEVFVDYGENWELAWERHLHSLKSVHVQSNARNMEWISAKVLNEELRPLNNAPHIDEMTSAENQGVTFTGCAYSSRDDWEIEFEGDWKRLPIDDLINEFATPPPEFCSIEKRQYVTDGSFWPCVVLERLHEEDEEIRVEDDYYTVRLLPYFNEARWEELQLPRIMTRYPRASIRHFYMPYKSDLHLPTAFRHHIELKDDIFPEQWKNR